MKKTLYLSALSILSLTLMGCSNNIAKVNGVEITKEDFQKTVEILAATSGYLEGKSVEEIIGIYENKENEDIKNAIISFMVDNELIYQVAKDKVPTPTNEEVKAKVEEIQKSINNNPSYKKKLEEIGINKEYLEKEIFKDLTIQKYRSNFENNIKITQEEIENYYNKNVEQFIVEEVSASHILFSTLDENKNQLINEDKKIVYQKAEEVSNRIKNGENFEEMARQYSDDKLSGKNGGRLGYFTKEDKNIEFSNEAFKLNKDEVSSVIETSYGYHIIKVNDRKNVIKDLNVCREYIEEKIINEKFVIHIEELKQKNIIKNKKYL